MEEPIVKCEPYDPLTANEETVRDILLYLLSPVYGGVLGGSILVSTICDHYTYQPDFEEMGGIYTRTYHLARPLNEEDKYVTTVPVGCEVKWVTYVYDSTFMRSSDIIFSDGTYDVNQLVTYYSLEDPASTWY